MDAEHDTPATPAAEVLDARLEEREVNAVEKAARVGASFVLGLVGGGAGDELLPGLTLVVTRRDSGSEVLRMRAGSGEEADKVLALARRDLETLTVEQFVREWSTVD